MAGLIVSQPGTVIALEGTGISPLAIAIDGFPSYPAILANLTQVNYQTAARFQLSNSMRNFTNVYVFGENAGDLVVGGVAFAASCQGGGTQSGLEQVSDYYAQTRLSRTGRSVNVQIGLSGSSRVRGMLIGASINVVDADNHLSQFALAFKSFTPESS